MARKIEALSMPKGQGSRYTAEPSFRLHEWLVEPDLNLISRDGLQIRLEVKIMELLTFFAQRGSRLLTRQELVDGVWNADFICDNTLTHAIAELRAALGDNCREPMYIETIHRRGYRLVAPVTTLEGRIPKETGSPSRYRIVDSTHSIQLREGANLIGRAPEATVRIDSIWVSRDHARILIDEAAATLEDLASRNGTFLNGIEVVRSMRLAAGDTIFLGKHTNPLHFMESGPQASTEPMTENTPMDRLARN